MLHEAIVLPRDSEYFLRFPPNLHIWGGRVVRRAANRNARFPQEEKKYYLQEEKYLQQIFSLADEKVSEFWVMQIQLEMFV